MAIPEAIKPITLEEVQAVEGLDEYKGMEIVDGVWTPKREEGGLSIGHGKTGMRVAVPLYTFVNEYKLGEVYIAETIFYLYVDENGVNRMRRPDIAFVVAARVNPNLKAYYFQAPDLAVEIISDSDRKPGVLHKKLTDYFTYGTQQVWLIYNEEKRIVVQNVDGTATTYSIEDTLSGGDLLPGFTLDVAAIFEL
ncbi:MAG: Uma2 family endonuclease [Burkholderiales bacterium]|nr:Uma2 family endonuclease [Anaerolineae bacterium]